MIWTIYQFIENESVGQYTIVCLYGGLIHAWVQVLIGVFRFAIKRFIYRNMGE